MENAILRAWNQLDTPSATLEVLACCGSWRWASQLARQRPFMDPSAVVKASEQIWPSLSTADWDEAFASHSRIGEKKAPASATHRSAQWSTQEQSAAAVNNSEVQNQLAAANELYEHRFGRTYIVCASGRTAEELLTILHARLENDAATELREACEQQRQITRLRLRKWLQL